MTTEKRSTCIPSCLPSGSWETCNTFSVVHPIRKALCRSLVRVHGTILSGTQRATSRVLETGVNTLQRTLVLKKQVEVDCQLAQKQQEFR
ncbi:hypothetical protein J4Q44_G00224280 [Coregonus suidteri]|uniref:Uncharacterized protein n=1 Tax=Coregonus suidteri TaxID=861788 RepID=A0AAN8QL99_9TELE